MTAGGIDAETGDRRRRLVSRALVVIGLAVFAIYLGLWAALIGGGHTEQADYTAFYTGWTIVADGRGADLYDPTVQAEVQREILGGRTFEAGLNPFNNPPHLVVPFVPLAWLPLDVSYLVWAAVQLALLGWLMWRLWTVVAADWSKDERLVLLAASLAASPLLITFLQGAFSLRRVRRGDRGLCRPSGEPGRTGWGVAGTGLDQTPGGRHARGDAAGGPTLAGDRRRGGRRAGPCGDRDGRPRSEDLDRLPGLPLALRLDVRRVQRPAVRDVEPPRHA